MTTPERCEQCGEVCEPYLIEDHWLGVLFCDLDCQRNYYDAHGPRDLENVPEREVE